jgi:hypothetical protein
MSTRSRRFIEIAAACGLLGAAVASGVAFAGTSKPAPTDMETGFRSAYPELDPARVVSLSSATYAGVSIDSLVLPGLTVRTRDDRRVEDGGIQLSYEDAHGDAQLLLHVAVAADAEGARAFVDRSLRNVSVALPRATDSRLGDAAWADSATGDSFVIGVIGNVGYRVQIVGKNSGVRASDVVRMLRATMAPGAVVFPSVSLSIPRTLTKDGGAITVTSGSGLTPKLRAEGGYIVRGQDGTPRVKPFAKDVTVIATLTDAQGRVGEARASASFSSK